MKGEEKELYINKSKGNPKKYNTGGSVRTDDRSKIHQGEGNARLGGVQRTIEATTRGLKGTAITVGRM